MTLKNLTVLAIWLGVVIMTVRCQDIRLAYNVLSLSGTFFRLNFTVTRLIDFKKCLCATSTQRCDLYYPVNGVVSRIETTQFSSGSVYVDSYSKTYMCGQVSDNSNHIKCSRQSKTMCSSSRICEDIKVHGDNTPCEMGTAKFTWDPSQSVSLTYIGNITFTFSSCHPCFLTTVLARTTTLPTTTTTTPTTSKTTSTTSTRTTTLPKTATTTTPTTTPTESTTQPMGTTTSMKETKETSTIKDSNVSPSTPENEDNDDLTVPVIGVIVAVLIILVIIGAVFVVVRKRRKRLASQSKHAYGNRAVPSDEVGPISKTAVANENLEYATNVTPERHENASLNISSQRTPSSITHVYDRIDDEETTVKSIGTSLNVLNQQTSPSHVSAITDLSRVERNTGKTPTHVGFYSNTYDHPNSGDGSTDKRHPYAGLKIGSKQDNARYANSVAGQRKTVGNPGKNVKDIRLYSNVYDRLDTDKRASEKHVYKSLSPSQSRHNNEENHQSQAALLTSSTVPDRSPANNSFDGYITPIDSPYKGLSHSQPMHNDGASNLSQDSSRAYATVPDNNTSNTSTDGYFTPLDDPAYSGYSTVHEYGVNGNDNAGETSRNKDYAQYSKII